MSELSTCPFDGGVATLGEITEAEAVVGGYVKCETCGATVRGVNTEEAICKWNAREELPTEPEPPEPPDEESTVRFYPGHCMTVDVGSGGGGLDGWCNQIAEIAPYPEWKLAGVLLNWDDIEPATQGVYDFTIFDRLVKACKDAGKRLSIGIKFQWFGNPTKPQGKLPAYLDTIENGKPGYSCRKEGEPAWSGNLSLYVHLHDERVMTCYINMIRALAAHVADDETLHIIAFGETAVDAPDSSGFTTEKWYNQLTRYAYEARKAFPYIEVRMGTNYLGDKQTMCELLDDLDAYDIMPGGPDNYSRSYDSNLAQNGQVDGKDRRGRCAWMSENQRPAGSSGGDDTKSAEVYEHNTEGDEELGGSMYPHYWQWSRNYDDYDPWPKVRQYVIDIHGACNTTNPHAGKMVRRAAPKHRKVTVTNPTRIGIDDLWPDNRERCNQ